MHLLKNEVLAIKNLNYELNFESCTVMNGPNMYQLLVFFTLNEKRTKASRS